MNHIWDHPLRYELHTRLFPSMTAPGTVAFLALKQAFGQDRDRDADRGFCLSNCWIVLVHHILNRRRHIIQDILVNIA
jgi:hypothetical protein